MQQTQIRITLQNDVLVEVKKIAVGDGRSMNKQITQIIKEYIQKQTVKN